MRLILFLMLGVLLPGAAAQAPAGRIEGPAVKVGDAWIYNKINGWNGELEDISVVRVMEATAEGILLQATALDGGSPALIRRTAGFNVFSIEAPNLVVNLGALDTHGQVFYATGDDRNTKDKTEAFFIPRGQSYYWSEIMGLGIFDNQASKSSCADKISNILAANLGVGFKASDKLSFAFDVWYAKLAESDVKNNDVLGTEVDLKMTYSLMKNLNLDVVAAYLFTGDATYVGSNDKDAYELGTRLLFSF